MAPAPPERSPSSGRVPGARWGSRNVRRGLVLVLVAALSVPIVLAPDRLAIQVDGETVRVRSYAHTVEQALTAAGVEVGPDDRVLPGGQAPVVDGLGIEVLRAVQVSLSIDGRIRVLPVAGRTVEDVLVAAGIGDVRGLSVTPDPSTPLSEADRVEVVEPVDVRIEVDGRTHVVRMVRGTVGEALRLAAVDVRRRDELSVPRGRRVAEDLTVTVTRRDTRRVVEEVVLPFHEQVVPTDELYEDEQVVVQEGAEGLRRDTYRLTLVDGEETGRKKVAETVVREAVDRVVHVGTAPRPAPEPPPPPPPAEDDSVWDRLAQCESGGNWSYDGTYDGGLQFHPDTWNRWKPDGYPDYAHQASREQQIEVGKRLQAARGWAPWPHCSQELGLR